MPELKLAERSPEEIQEMPLVELAYQILAESNESYYYRDLMKKIAEWRNMDEEAVAESIARLYTDINIDGRFLCVGENVWGLRRWYPVERMAERGTSKRFMRKDVAADDLDEEDLDEDFDLDEEAELVEEEPFVFEDEDALEDGAVDDELEFVEDAEIEDDMEAEEAEDEDADEF